jgi:hypothetical protein
MNPAPTIVGGAAVALYSPIDQRHRPTGGTRQIVAGVLQGPATGLAIGQPEVKDHFYLFGCDENWQVKTHTWHQTLEEAMDQAEFEYEGVRKTWLNHRPAWEPMTESEELAIWDLFYEQFRFKPSVKSSDWPGIQEPAESVTYDVSHVFGEGGMASSVNAVELNMEMFRLFRELLLPSQRLYALDWQHPCYWFNPYGLFDFSPVHNGMIPVIPDGDYSIFVADDFHFGTFGHPWEQTICVWGEPLLELVSHRHPRMLGKVTRRNGKAVD